MAHVVTVKHQTPRLRAECSCSWTSPWITQTVRPDEDIPARPLPDVIERASRAARWHLDQTARSRP